MFETVRYTPTKWPEALDADIYPQDRIEPGPAVVLIHGGGWSGRSRTDMNSVARRLVAKGYVVFNISYRFAPEYRYPAQIHDVQIAISWLRENAAAYHIDPSRIGVWGYSSGAHLAAMLGVLREGDELDEVYGGESSRVKLVVAGGLPSEFQKFPFSPILKEFIGGFLAEFPNEYQQGSPITYVGEQSVPFHLYHARRDKLVPLDQASDFAEKLTQANVYCELRTYPIWGHTSQFVVGLKAQKQAIKFLDSNL